MKKVLIVSFVTQLYKIFMIATEERERVRDRSRNSNRNCFLSSLTFPAGFSPPTNRFFQQRGFGQKYAKERGRERGEINENEKRVCWKIEHTTHTKLKQKLVWKQLKDRVVT